LEEIFRNVRNYRNGNVKIPLLANIAGRYAGIISTNVRTMGEDELKRSSSETKTGAEFSVPKAFSCLF
jgi:hypothetical protein